MDLNFLNKVWEVKPLTKVREDEAREILEKVAKQVQPIMHKRKWKVKVLSEFWPTNPTLYGLNIGGGAEIKLRLRRPNNEWDFFPFNQILDTMLHELCHNEYGPHNADFYSLLDDIRKECEELMVKGRALDLPGRRLGGFSQQPPISTLRQNALAAAENRSRCGPLLPSGPKRIGGDSGIMAALTPIQAAAMAAERRLHDDVWCGSKFAGIEGSSESFKASSSSQDASFQTFSVSPAAGQVTGDVQPLWQCGNCTLFNKRLALTCEACGTIKDEGNGAKKSKIWTCKFCTLHNRVGVDRCLACGEWRYSYGPPSSMRGPYLGT